MKLSHSKLSLILSNPMEYYLSYKLGIVPKFTKPALNVGSATHWGIEHNKTNLDEFFGTTDDVIGEEQIQAEAMVHGYNYHKEQIFDELLTDEDGSKLELLKEMHELYIDGKLKSFTEPEPHIFVGVIDLLLLTNKGFIVVDYKTSSTYPNWESYLEQLYRYIFLLKSEFPDVPVIKLAIINLRKTKIRQLRSETSNMYLNRLKQEYEINDNSLVNWHIWKPQEFDEKFMNDYITNLSRMADCANLIDLHNMRFVNYGATNSYGGSVYKNLIYKTPNAYVLYSIRDTIYDKYTKEVKDMRDCRPIDELVLEPNSNILNKYEMFEAQALALFSVNKNVDKDILFKHLKKNFKTDDELLEYYWDTLINKVESEEIET